ncbi:MAG TPA: uroporphyrinogen decarboxylase family protein [Armatimonadota bacterium]|jgi:uroporphyrinogen-III decarboxylase
MTPSTPADRLHGFDFDAHNAEVKEMWEAFWAGSPTRTPVIVGTNTRFSILDPVAGASAPSFQKYMEDPDAMFDAQIAFQRWVRFNILQDADLGLPATAWWVSPDFQNTYEAGWFGCEVEFRDGQVPATRPDFEDCPERVMEHGLPDPFGGSLATGWEFYQYFKDRASREEYLGRPIEARMPGFGYGSDGVMTVACNLFGADFVCTTMATDPDRLHQLFDFIVQATIERVTAWRAREGLPRKRDSFIYADDSIALISTRMYREHVLPFHKMVFDALGTQYGRGIHLCGDATRHFKTLQDELNINWFDTGFPVDFARIREELGPDACIQGGPHVELVHAGTPGQVYDESVRILQTGVLTGGKFVLREGNNLAPGTPVENTESMYRAAREHGWKADDI